ncbi:MAG: hydratase [Oscillospiraceae bacterium]|nr:hydratase [Oscillospiraceae bacterium]
MKSAQAVEYICNKMMISGGKPKASDAASCCREKTMAYKILRAHNTGNGSDDRFKIKFDALISHDITYVSIIQTARAAGMTKFPIPYTLTNCHNSLCAVGGTINEDDHAFGLSAAEKYGGIYVPANQAVIHQYARETMVGCGKMILGSDSHTRYGCYGTLGIGEGGGELVKQLLRQTYDINAPEVILVWLEGAPRRGIGPHDVALALIKETFKDGRAKNKVIEFAGPGVGSLSMDFRIGIDVMTTETTCLTSIWETDDKVREYYTNISKAEAYKELRVEDGACYDAMVKVDLSEIEAMIALPFHPSNAYTIRELQQNPEKILKEAEDNCNKELGGKVKLDLMGCINKDGKVVCEQGIIVGCAGGMYENICEAADILQGKSIGNGYFDMSVYPASIPISLKLTKDGIAETLMKSGVLMKSAFCGPCFGAGDTPAHNTLSIRHATRNFANREGAKPGSGQAAAVALMDARSIAATAANKGVLTAATDTLYNVTKYEYIHDNNVYEKRCYNGFGKPNSEAELRFGPNIADWPKFHALEENMLLELCAVIHDEVTTTDELIPSGETSSYRSNPMALSEFTLSRRVPEYVAASKKVREAEQIRRENISATQLTQIADILKKVGGDIKNTSIGSCVFAKKPGDGSAREQAASCQRVLGGLANISYEYATKRYRSNCINWGIIPFTIDLSETFDYKTGDRIFIPNIRNAILTGAEVVIATMIANTEDGTKLHDITLKCQGLSEDERVIIADGCLMNHYAKRSIRAGE